MGTGHPSGKARVPVDGMDRIPRELAARFEALGGTVRLGHDVHRIEVGEGSVVLDFADGSAIHARRLVLTLPIPALEALAGASRSSTGRPGNGCTDRSRATRHQALLLVRPTRGATAPTPTGLRTTTDLPPRKVFYFDEAPDRPAAISPPSPTTGTTADRRPGRGPEWRSTVSDALLEALRGWLAAPASGVPTSLPSGRLGLPALGRRPREVAWHFWRSGANSDEAWTSPCSPTRRCRSIPCGEVFKRRGAWSRVP